MALKCNSTSSLGFAGVLNNLLPSGFSFNLRDSANVYDEQLSLADYAHGDTNQSNDKDFFWVSVFDETTIWRPVATLANSRLSITRPS